MSEGKRFLLRRATGDLRGEVEQEVRDWLLKGLGKAGDFLFDAASAKWTRLGEHPAVSSVFSRPSLSIERRVIYFVPPGEGMPVPQGPFSIKEIQQKLQARDLSESTWVFVEGDKEWRQVKAVKALLVMLPVLPTDPPEMEAASAQAAIESPEGLPVDSLNKQTNPSIVIDLETTGDHAPSGTHEFEREDRTLAISALGLNTGGPAVPPPGLKPLPKAPSAPVPPPPAPPTPVAAAPAAPPPLAAPVPAVPPATPATVKTAAPKDKDTGSFDGITAEIPTDPIWLVKPANTEAVSGPFRFLEVMKFLEEGKITKNDKISRVGANRFVRIQQQYEFNVKYSIETVVEGGVEKQKIFIRRRHPRVPYITGIQVMSRHGLLPGTCVNISAGGILMEMPKAEFNLGDIVELKILPGLIPRAISCKSLVIGRIPKIPPGFALKFEDLKQEDKEAIEHFVAEALKREMAKNS